MPDLRTFEAYNREISELDAGISKMLMADLMEREPTIGIVYFPCYGIILAFAAGWLLILAWWQRRKSRRLMLHTAP